MSKFPQWVGGLGDSLNRFAERLERKEASEPSYGAGEPDRPGPVADAGGDRVDGPGTAASGVAPEPAHVPPPPAYAPAVAAKPDPGAVVPWGVRVAAEAGWRLLVLAGTVWVLMKVISAVQLVVLSFTVALLITALLEPTVARLRGKGLPRGLATAITFISGFVIMGLVCWFVVWQVMENLDTLSDKIQDGIDDLRHRLLNSPFHVTDSQINGIANNLRDAISHNTQTITSAGIEGVTVIVEVLTGVLLAMFCTLFLLYDGPRIWSWVLKLVPAAAREGVAGAGPRAWATLTSYVRGTVIVAMIDAISIGIGIYFLDVPMAVPLAVFIFLFAFVPLVGAVVSGALAVVVALVTQGVVTAALVVGVVLAVQQIEGHILQPFILGRAVRVHPLAVVLSVASGSMVGGVGGAVVAVPLVAVLNTVVSYLRTYAQENAMRTAAGAGPGGAEVAAGPPAVRQAAGGPPADAGAPGAAGRNAPDAGGAPGPGSGGSPGAAGSGAEGDKGRGAEGRGAEGCGAEGGGGEGGGGDRGPADPPQAGPSGSGGTGPGSAGPASGSGGPTGASGPPGQAPPDGGSDDGGT